MNPHAARSWCSAAAIAALLSAHASVAAQPAEPEPPGVIEPVPAEAGAGDDPVAPELTPEASQAIERGLEALAEMQDADGSFPSRRYGKNVAVTSLACLAFMAGGSLPGRGPYGDEVERGMQWVLDQQTETGLLAADTSHGPMYGHGFATLFLGEVYGMTMGGDTETDRRLHEALISATRLIVSSQNDEGGWRYNPVPNDADVSVTICQVMALRSVRNAGIEVPKAAIDDAVEYVRNCQSNSGGFRYQSGPGPDAWPRTGAGVATLYYAGAYDDAGIEPGLQYLVNNAMPGTGRPGLSHYYYGQYYATQAMFLAGGDWWDDWWPAVREELLDAQLSDSTWMDHGVGEAYGTSMALIVLQMPTRYLPIFQR